MSEQKEYPSFVKNPKLWDEARKQADEIYNRPSAYKSMYISKVYKKIGGRYKTKAKKKQMPTEMWLKEKWIQILPYIDDGDELACGRDDGKPNACRPKKNVKDGENNITIDAIIKKYGKKKVRELTKKKLNDMNGRLDWKNGKFIPSSKIKREKQYEPTRIETDPAKKSTEKIDKAIKKEKL